MTHDTSRMPRSVISALMEFISTSRESPGEPIIRDASSVRPVAAVWRTESSHSTRRGSTAPEIGDCETNQNFIFPTPPSLATIHPLIILRLLSFSLGLPVSDSLTAPVCVGCGTGIVEDRVLKALGEHWHHKCFICSHCRQPMEGRRFYLHDDCVYCPQDYTEVCKEERERERMGWSCRFASPFRSAIADPILSHV